MNRVSINVRAAVAVLLGLMVTKPAAAQHDPAAGRSRAEAEVGAHVVPLVTHVSPILGGESRTEMYVTQPTLLAAAALFGGILRLNAAVSLEGLTLDGGELGAGAYGEGFVDRRHPHTYLHELVVSAQHGSGRVAGSLAGGRGFAPFGTDDPMMRPFVKFPVNHHLGQILERLIVIGGVRVGPVLAEAGLFGGNEPVDAEDTGSLDRFGDSWSARATVNPVRGIELQASRAWVVSPEMRIGGGWDQRKWSVSARYDRQHTAGSLYALVEWNRTTQVDRGSDIFSFGSLLAEAALDTKGWRPAIRLERAERPEEQRLMDPFRTTWPHAGGHVLGITRWSIAAARIERTISAGTLRIAPFVEGSMSHVTETADGLFDPAEFYGADTIWTINVGARVRAGWHPLRMGRYGVAAPAAPVHEH
jgi:hypothetical protein